MNKKQAKQVSHLRTKMSFLLLMVVSLLSVANAQSVIGSKLILLPTDQVINNQFN